jgi:serine/threonine-protein kinase HipA
VAANRRAVEVHADWLGLAGPQRMGTLYVIPARGRDVFSFEYDQAWLDLGHTGDLDPSLRLAPGPQFLADGRENFGVFLDSSPDRWGRTLLQRREAQLARREGRHERRLTELDYLLGVYDGHRLGGLRYRIGDSPFLDDDARLASPPWTSLRELEEASLHLEADSDGPDSSHEKWLRLLIAPGRSLGGARPKASVLDTRKHLWIAKFPSARDLEDMGAWESVVTSMAERAGVHVPPHRRLRFGSNHHTFLSKRFDRTDDGQRLHFASAMTLLQRSDGDAAAGYLNLAEILIQQGAEPARDLEQLWRRIIFFVCVSNVDDHLRNHGFLLSDGGWVLSPAYDINPVATGGGLTLNISETDNAQDLELVREVAEFFRVGAKRSRVVIEEVTGAVRTWRKLAKAAGISRSEQDRMAPAFSIAEAQ